IAATLASTGTPAFFMHPAEASHGDLGMITPKDVIIAISFSGGTVEVLNLLPYLDRTKVPLITLSRAGSALAQAAQVNLDIGFAVEACPLDLAPTSSTTVSLVVGDALAISVSSARGLTKENFSLFHPGGLLGKRLLLRVQDIMHQGQQLPKVLETATLNEALIEMTSKRLGMTTVVDKDGKLTGIFTDGDLRRALQNKIDVHQVSIKEVMTASSKTIAPDMLAAAALELMETHKITALIVVDNNSKPLGVLHIHDLLQLGLTQ
ncbi:MAG TPA: KpsF/GutQ family sugar-phosphate isomerase, partial [Coxiellaceae bacterium]|nr:KpsF/GutQ family sugar-phosphate isomerase [Coxiellaceae bacterium]